MTREHPKEANLMTISEWEKQLREKERELLADMARTEAGARATAITETQNGAVAAESKESLLQETTSEWNIFTQVRDALQRIRLGTFGKCVDCGRQIEDRRLNAVPWTAYCFDHENRHDRDLAQHST
jgi:DnaK suppressor protein